MDDVSKVCANCRLHKVFFDEYGFDGCICDAGNDISHINSCLEFQGKTDKLKECDNFERKDIR